MQFVRTMENLASLGVAIRKYSKSKVVKEDYQLLQIKIGLFIIPGSEPLGISAQLCAGYT